ncbi:DUF2127 domain-containing protein [Psychromicrobium xiongbiense]|uniref:DUF2127 domain-containing protein n=1 Tax=Psychromicrobium xiongbiense TaxID=3051184 RepID=UPI002552B94A|nr:DUF2127 domain-containing protein [Psychromicrobium sp. YIM S02556]
MKSAKALETVYRIGIAIKGFDGVVELVAGLALWFFPELLTSLLSPIATPVEGHHPIRNFIGYWAGRMDHELSSGSHAFVIFFLLAHGIVKIVLVYCLFKEYHWVYPYALAVLGLFTAYQIYVLITRPTIGMVLFTLLDLVIMWLVWREWRELVHKATASSAAPAESASTE